MFTYDEFISRYEKYNDDEILATFQEIKGYSPVAQDAFMTVVKRRGGEEYFLNLAAEKRAYADEMHRIQKEADNMYRTGESLSSAKRKITSDMLPKQKLEEAIEDIYHQREWIKEDMKIKPRTIYGGFIGGSIGPL